MNSFVYNFEKIDAIEQVLSKLFISYKAKIAINIFFLFITPT